MRPSIRPPLRILVTSLFIARATALYALPDSPCAAQCGNVLSSTTGDDIVCSDSDYPASGFTGLQAGITYQNCVGCQVKSTYVDPTTGQTDLQWALYNLRYAMSWCLFGFPNNTAVVDTPCITSFACEPLVNAFEFDNLSTNAAPYGYCTDDMLSNVVTGCSLCTAQITEEFYLTNFLTALSAACQQQPSSGSTISIEGSLFSKTAVNITLPTASSSANSGIPSGSLSLGERVGIAIGAIVVLLTIAGVCVIRLGKRKRRKALAARQNASGYTEWKKHMDETGGFANMRSNQDGNNSAISGQFFDSPQSQRPLNTSWGRPARHDGSPLEKTYFSPYSSQYSSPVSATDAVSVAAREWPYAQEKTNMDMSSGSGHMLDRESSTGSTRKFAKEPPGERIEMQDVAPVLHQPTHGRNYSVGSVRTIPLTEDDFRKGKAV